MSIQICNKCMKRYDTAFDPACPRCEKRPTVKELTIYAEVQKNGDEFGRRFNGYNG